MTPSLFYGWSLSMHPQKREETSGLLMYFRETSVMEWVKDISNKSVCGMLMFMLVP